MAAAAADAATAALVSTATEAETMVVAALRSRRACPCAATDLVLREGGAMVSSPCETCDGRRPEIV